MEADGAAPSFRTTSTTLTTTSSTAPTASLYGSASAQRSCSLSYPKGIEELENRSEQGQSQQGDRAAAIDAEMAMVNKLPTNSSYAVHRMKVLNKLRHLMSIKRTTAQDEELELLFASLSI